MKLWISLWLMSMALGSAAQAQDILITNLDRFSVRAPTLRNFTRTQWLSVGFTTDDNSYELQHVEPLVQATQLAAGVIAELRSGSVNSGPGALVASFDLVSGPPRTFVPSQPFTLLPNTTYYFSLGYPLENATVTDWFTSESDFTADGPATREKDWVSQNQGSSWLGGGNLNDARSLFEVIVAPEPASVASRFAALAALALVRHRKRAAAPGEPPGAS